MRTHPAPSFPSLVLSQDGGAIRGFLIELENSFFSNCHAVEDGGAMSVQYATLTGVLFANTSAGQARALCEFWLSHAPLSLSTSFSCAQSPFA